jgi:UDP-N-acetylmuramate--alanine ligase
MQKIYFIGIGGIGMSALARYYKHAGALVAGYDRTPSALTAELEQEGIAIHYEDNLALIPEVFFTKPEEVLVIYTPAVPETHSEWQYFRKEKYTLIKRSAALGHIAAGKTTLAVAGTHGKTTTTTLLAHLLTQASAGCTAFLGGISKNYDTNLLLSNTAALVAEADEFDRSFLQLFPQIAIITATDADHLDIYGSAEAMKQAFVAFAEQVKPDGVLILKAGIDLPFKQQPGQRLYRYSFDSECDFYAANICRLDNGLTKFDLHLQDTVLPDCVLGIPGWVNVENAVAAAAAAYVYGADGQQLKKALATFSGVQRRFDIRLNTPKVLYIDDYAHHPEELRAAISSLRETFPARKITGIFQPHLYTRTRDFAAGFASSLSLLDALILLDIYPAREIPIEGVSSRIILDKVTIPEKELCRKEELLDILKTKTIDVLVTFGAGDIDRLVQPITDLLIAMKQ